jgi:hypothetical protein
LSTTFLRPRRRRLKGRQFVRAWSEEPLFQFRSTTVDHASGIVDDLLVGPLSTGHSWRFGACVAVALEHLREDPLVELEVGRASRSALPGVADAQTLQLPFMWAILSAWMSPGRCPSDRGVPAGSPNASHPNGWRVETTHPLHTPITSPMM